MGKFYEILGFPNKYEPVQEYDKLDSNAQKRPFITHGGNNILDKRNVRAIYEKYKWENPKEIPGCSQDSESDSLFINPLLGTEKELTEREEPLDQEPSSAKSEALPRWFGYNPRRRSITKGCWCFCVPSPAEQENLGNREMVKITSTEVRYTEHDDKNMPMVKFTLVADGKTRSEIFVDMANYDTEIKKSKIDKTKFILRLKPKESFNVTHPWFWIIYLTFDDKSSAKAFKKRLENKGPKKTSK